MPLDDLEDFRRHVLGVVPVFLVPLLEHADRRPGDLHVQFDVLGDARQGEVRRADQGEGADHFLPGVGDVGLGVELVLLVDPALDLARADRLHDGRNAGEEVVLLLLGFQAVVQPRLDLLQSVGERLLGAARNLVAHEDANGIDLLPLVLQAQQPADLEVARGHVDGLGELAPVVQVALDLPVVVAVIDDEQFAAGLACAFGHVISVRARCYLLQRGGGESLCLASAPLRSLGLHPL